MILHLDNSLSRLSPGDQTTPMKCFFCEFWHFRIEESPFRFRGDDRALQIYVKTCKNVRLELYYNGHSDLTKEDANIHQDLSINLKRN